VGSPWRSLSKPQAASGDNLDHISFERKSRCRIFRNGPLEPIAVRLLDCSRCWTVQGVGLFKVAAKVVAAISFFPSAGLPIDSHLRYHRVDSSESPCPFVKPTNKSRSLCLARNKLVFDWCRHRSCLLGSHWGIPPKVAGVARTPQGALSIPPAATKVLTKLPFASKISTCPIPAPG
jgi:hypothetical protein